MPFRPLALVALAVALTSSAIAQTSASKAPLPVPENWRQISIALSSILTPQEDVKISSRAAGVVQRIHVKDGAIVKKDDPLISLDSTQEAAELAQSEAALRAVEAEYVRISKEFERIKMMREDNQSMVTPKDFEEHVSLEAIARARCDQARANVMSTRDKLDSRTIRSPIDGVFMKTSKSVGEAVERFEHIARVIDDSVLELELTCDTTYRGRFTQGQRVSIQVENPQRNYPKVSGRVVYVDRVIDPTSSSFRVKIEVQPSEDAVGGFHATVLLDDSKPETKTADRG